MLKNKDFWIVFLVVVAGIIFIFSFYIGNSLILETKEVEAILVIGDISAFNINSSVLNFGVINKKSMAKRSFLLENNYDFPIKASMSVSGLIKDFLFYNKTIYLGPKETKSIEFTAVSEKNSNYGEYLGKVKIIIRRIK